MNFKKLLTILITVLSINSIVYAGHGEDYDINDDPTRGSDYANWFSYQSYIIPRSACSNLAFREYEDFDMQTVPPYNDLDKKRLLVLHNQISAERKKRKEDKQSSPKIFIDPLD